MNQTRIWPALMNRFPQRTQDKCVGHRFLMFPADDASREQVHQQRQISRLSSSQWDVSDVSCPHFVDPSRLRAVLERIRVLAQTMSTICYPRLERLRLNRSQACLSRSCAALATPAVRPCRLVPWRLDVLRTGESESRRFAESVAAVASPGNPVPTNHNSARV